MARARMPEKTILLICIAVIAVLTLGMLALCHFKLKAIKKVRQETADLAKKAGELQKKISKLTEKEEERDRFAIEIEEYEKMLPDAKEVEGLMTVLSEQARFSECEVSDFSLVAERARMVRGGAPQTTYTKVNFEVSLSCRKRQKGYFAACKFLNLLERYERFIAADTFTVKSGKGMGESMSMELKAHTYVFTGKKAAAGGRKKPARPGARRG